MSGTGAYLDTDDLVSLTCLLLGDPPPIRDFGLLDAAAARPQASAFGEDAYPDLWAKAGALLHSIVKSHPLVDGNKRLGWLAAAVYLEINGIGIAAAPNVAVYRLVMRVAAENVPAEQVAQMLREIT